MVNDTRTWDDLERYVKDMVKTFAHDRRIVVWDLYNEPSRSLPLVEAAFRWARQAGPDQPLTTCVYGGSCDPKRLAEISDVVSFHCYGPLADMKKAVEELAAAKRPLLCTEWMCRPNSRFETHLPYLKEHKVGAWSWGLVAGRTQTYFPWGSPQAQRSRNSGFTTSSGQTVRRSTPGKSVASAWPRADMIEGQVYRPKENACSEITIIV